MTVNRQPARVISVTSGKGGVGKTHTTVNLGVALAKSGKRVLLLDADLGLANINIMLGFQPQATLEAVFSGEHALRDIIVHHPVGSDGTYIDVIPASSGISEVTELTDEQRMTLVSAFDELGYEYDFLLVDTGAGIGGNVMYFNVAAEQIIVVIDPEPTSFTDAYALIKVMSTRFDTKAFDVLVNRVPVGADGRTTFAKLAQAAGKFLPVKLNYIGSIAEDGSLGEAVIRQTPLLQLFPSSKASRDYVRLAAKLAANEGSRTAKGGMQFFFRSILECT